MPIERFQEIAASSMPVTATFEAIFRHCRPTQTRASGLQWKTGRLPGKLITEPAQCPTIAIAGDH